MMKYLEQKKIFMQIKRAVIIYNLSNITLFKKKSNHYFQKSKHECIEKLNQKKT